MKRQDIISIIVTFLVGVVVGSYLYLYGFAPQYNTLIDSASNTGQLVIAGEAYGGCARGGICATFQVTNDGTFKAFPTQAREAERVVQTGKISTSLYQQFRASLTSGTLTRLAAPVTPKDCASHTDGIDYQLRIFFGDEQFTLDTCTTALADNLEQQILLDKLVIEMNI